MKEENKYVWHKRREKYKRMFGENMMEHGSRRFPFEYFAVDWGTGVKSQDKEVVLDIIAANSFERELNHEPAYISQEELGNRRGVTQQAVSQSIKRLKAIRFTCPHCLTEEIAKEGCVKIERAKKATPEYPKGINLTWTDGYKEIINHLTGHYNEYVEKYGSKRGRFYYLQFRNEWLARKRKGLDIRGEWLEEMRKGFENPKEEQEDIVVDWDDEWD